MYAAYKQQTQSPLTTVDWLVKALEDKMPNLIVLDVSIPMPGEKRDCYAEYKEKHIPGAQFLNLSQCRDVESTNSYMLPKDVMFAEFMSKLGVTNSTQVVLYDANERFGMFSSPRAWWMFRVFGHTNVTILDGGLHAWIKAGNSTESGDGDPVTPVTGYKTAPNAKLVKKMDEVKENITSKQWQLVDARSEGRFTGKAPEPRPDIKPGHIPNAKCMFWTKFLGSDKLYKSTAELKEIYQLTGIDVSQPHAATCGSGVTACFIALNSYMLGNYDVPVYDGAWMEWYLCAPSDLKVDVPTDE